jgi:nucleoid DNA-binding protein
MKAYLGTEVPTSEAQKHFEAFERVVTEALKASEEVQITGFGKFSVKERKAREGRNPPDRAKYEDRGPEGSRLQRRQRS